MFTLFLPTRYRPIERRPEVLEPPEPAETPTSFSNGAPRRPGAALPEPLTDDRADLAPGDRVALLMSEDPELARSAVGVAHEQDFKCLLALRGDAGLALVHEFMPEAVVVSRELPQVDGEAVLDHLKRHPQTRHIPVYVLAEDDRAHESRRSGARRTSRPSRSRPSGSARSSRSSASSSTGAPARCSWSRTTSASARR